MHRNAIVPEALQWQVQLFRLLFDLGTSGNVVDCVDVVPRHLSDEGIIGRLTQTVSLKGVQASEDDLPPTQ